MYVNVIEREGQKKKLENLVPARNLEIVQNVKLNISKPGIIW